MTTLKVLKARYGDASILEVTRGEDSFIMVIDGGPKGACPAVENELLSLPKIDMIVLTNFDEDHIMGILNFANQYEEKFANIGKFWLKNSAAAMSHPLIYTI